MSDLDGDGLLVAQRRIRRLGGVFDLAGSLTHSTWLAQDRFKVVMTRPLVAQFWSSVGDLLHGPASSALGQSVKGLSQSLSRKLSHLLIADQADYEHEDNLECVMDPSLDDDGGDLVFALACVARAVRECADANGARACVLLVPDGAATFNLTVRGPSVEPTAFRVAADPAALGQILSEFKGQTFPATLTVPCEGAPDWNRADVSRSAHERALKRLIADGGGRERKGKGDHKVFEVRIDGYLPWRDRLTKLCVDSRSTQVARGRAFPITLTVDQGKTHMRPSYAAVPAAKAGLPPALAWRLMFQGDSARVTPALADLLSGDAG